MKDIIKRGTPQPLPEREKARWYGKCSVCGCEFECNWVEVYEIKYRQTYTFCPTENCIQEVNVFKINQSLQVEPLIEKKTPTLFQRIFKWMK